MTKTFGSSIVLGVLGGVLLWVPATAQAASHIRFDGIEGEARAIVPASETGEIQGTAAPAQKPQEAGMAPGGEPDPAGGPVPRIGEGGAGASTVPTEAGTPPAGTGTLVEPIPATTAADVDAPSEPVAVSAAALRELSPEQRELLVGSAPQDPEAIATPEDLRSFVAATIEQHPQISAVHVEEAKVLVRYETPAKLFGFIPLTVTETIEVMPGKGDEEYAVSVHKPWYSFLLSETAPGAAVTALAKGKKKPKPSEPIPIESFSFGSSNAGRVIKLIADGIGQANDAFEREADQAADR
ncbi:hypothetical protein FJY94_00610 [Candidatus Kaiserbacteria bacterium]|nr:hypothetical protein [Candidatus Kaiserbacteria bacterium]